MATKAATPTKRQARRESKRAEILKIARSHFREFGYGGVSMSAIAAELGGSKRTLWAHFASKEDLFAATWEGLIADYAPCLSLEPDEPLEPALTRYGHHFLTIILSPQVMALNRLVIAEAGRFPEIGKVFWEFGPQRRYRNLAAFFDAKMERGELRRGDSWTLAAQFHHLCHYRLVMRDLWGVPLSIDSEAIAREVSDSVGLFLHGSVPHEPTPAPSGA